MLVTPGPYAPTVTQHVPNGTFTTDRYNNKVPNFDDTARRVIAQYPGNSMEDDNAVGDRVVADLVLLVPPDVAVAATDEWTATDGQRYRVEGQPYRYQNPHSGTAITQVNLRRIT